MSGCRPGSTDEANPKCEPQQTDRTFVVEDFVYVTTKNVVPKGPDRTLRYSKGCWEYLVWVQSTKPVGTAECSSCLSFVIAQDSCS